MSHSTVPELLIDLIDHTEDIVSNIDRFHAAQEDLQPTIRSAILWHLIVIGEISLRLGEPFHTSHPEIPWRRIIDQRNIVAHGYDGIDWDLLFALRKQDLPELIENAKNILKSYPPPPPEQTP